MKTFLIVILSLALMAAAFFTRPSEADFEDYVRARLPQDGRSLPEKILGRPRAAEQHLAELSFHDRFLWVHVEDKTGKVVYTGAFDHWFASPGGALAEQDTTPAEKPRRADKPARDAGARGQRASLE